ncbi:DUF3798 domain-containing protein [Clostridiaceae bacterium 35-E11]
MKKVLAILMAVIMSFSIVACSSNSGSSTDTTQNEGAEKTEEKSNYKIGIMTSTVSQGEEQYRAAEKLAKTYPDIVTLVTFPEKFTTEQETSISTALSLAADPDIKAIVFCQAVQGSAAAMQKIKEIRPDILLVAGAVQDDISVISSVADVAYHMNIPDSGTQLVHEMYELGARTFVHYSFPRHLAFQPTADRRENIKKACEELGMTFVDATTPDPTSDAGVSGTQQFILEDVPRKVAEYGKDTAFFGTNTAQQEPMIKAVLQTESFYTMPADPSPFAAFPGALGIQIPEDKMADADYMMEQISIKLAEAGMTNHMGTWSAPLMTMFLNGGFKYAMAFCDGETNGEKLDVEVFKKYMAEAAGSTVEFVNYKDKATGNVIDNFFYILAEYVPL